MLSSIGNEEMVRSQIAGRGVTSQIVLDAFLNVDRKLFVPDRYKTMAYSDSPLPIGNGQTISQPFMVALMLDALNAEKGMKVLEVGSGSGYVLALLHEMGLEVVGIEISRTLAESTEGRLKENGFDSVVFYTGDGGEGLPEHSPFDRILISAGCVSVPPPLFDQLKSDGILVAPVDEGYSSQLKRYSIKKDGSLVKEDLGGCVFVPLTGRYGR